MDSQKLPEWLDGTPILVDTTNMAIYKGSDAIFKISNVIQEVSSTTTTEKVGSPSQHVKQTNQDLEVSNDFDDSGKSGEIDNVFTVDKEAQERARLATDSKVTSDDVQKLLEERNRLIKPQIQQM